PGGVVVSGISWKELFQCSRRPVGGERFAERSAYSSEGKTKTEMECADVFARLPVGINSIIEPNRADRQFVTQAPADRVMHVVNARLFGRGQEIAGIIKHRALEFAIDRKSVLDIEDGEKLTADRIAFWIVRTEIALAVTAHSSGAAIEEAFVDR